MRYFWTIGGGWSEASSIDDLVEYYRRSGNLQNSFIAVEVDYSGNKTNITQSIRDAYEKRNSPKQNSSSGKGCFIATACYGDYDAPQVLLFRRFRDESLLSSGLGRKMVDLYYWLSPPLARKLSSHPAIAECIRNILLDPLARLLRKRYK